MSITREQRDEILRLAGQMGPIHGMDEFVRHLDSLVAEPAEQPQDDPVDYSITVTSPHESQAHADDARAAMAALIIVRCDPSDVARNSYNYADAMQAERKRRRK